MVKIRTNEKQEYEKIKFYNPIFAEISETIIPYDGIDIPNEIALNYIHDIQKSIKASISYEEEAERGLVVYIKDKQLNTNVASIIPSVEEYNGKLYGVANVKLNNQLTHKEMDDLKDYILGQYSDGWGEGFEQRDIKTKDGNIGVSFWNYENFYIKSERELKGDNSLSTNETEEIKLYSPLNVFAYYEEIDCSDFYVPEKETTKLSSIESIDYINEMNNCMDYIDYKDVVEIVSNIDQNLYKKIVNIKIEISDVVMSDLYAVTEVRLKEELADSEIDTLKDCISKKYCSLKKGTDIEFYGNMVQLNIRFDNNISTEEEFKIQIEQEHQQSIGYTM